jgi:hypothetical protein
MRTDSSEKAESLAHITVQADEKKNSMIAGKIRNGPPFIPRYSDPTTRSEIYRYPIYNKLNIAKKDGKNAFFIDKTARR